MTSASDREAELAVLAACLASPVARAEAKRHLVGADFDDPRHEEVWNAMARLERHGKPVDPTTLNATLDAKIKPLLVELVTTLAMPDNVAHYAEIVRGWALRRRLHAEATRVMQQALSPNVNAAGYAATVATRFAGIRDVGVPDNTTALMIGELLAEPDDEPDWLIPDLLERRDRLILTGEEGLGKSHLLRQIAVLAAAGLDPFHTTRIKPLRVTIIDCENSARQIKRKIRPLYDFATRYGQDPVDRVLIECTSRVDITRDKDLAQIHNLLDAMQPDLVIIGPLYRLTPHALQTDDEAAPVLAALDTLRDRGAALLMEAHAGHTTHGQGGGRNLRPRGSSALLGWPEFGYGLKSISHTFCDVVPWRGDRDERKWPERLRREVNGARWLPTEAFDYGEIA